MAKIYTFIGILAFFVSVNGIAGYEAGSAGKDLLVSPGETIISTDSNPDAPVGTYAQPRWSTERSFSDVRSYLIPEDSVEAEFWIVAKGGAQGSGNLFLFQQEIEGGFAKHFQADFYVNEWQAPDTNNVFQMEGLQLELRYAFADWDKIFANPTLYLEYHPRFSGFPDKAEVRFLATDSFAPKWRWAVNLGAETELSQMQTHEYAITLGTSRAVIRNTLAVGVEAKAEYSDVTGSRGTFNKEYYAGPSIQWKPEPKSHIDFTPYIGLNNVSHTSEVFFIFGWDI